MRSIALSATLREALSEQLPVDRPTSGDDELVFLPPRPGVTSTGPTNFVSAAPGRPHEPRAIDPDHVRPFHDLPARVR